MNVAAGEGGAATAAATSPAINITSPLVGGGGEREPVRLTTPGYEGFAVKFDPFEGKKLACATAANFGMKGPGRLWIFEQPWGNNSHGRFPHQKSAQQIYDVSEGIYDVAWSEEQPTILVGALADGAIALFDLKIPNRAIHYWREHGREANCVDWNNFERDRFLSASFDGTIKIWNVGLAGFKKALLTLEGHVGQVYQAAWSPREGSVLLSVGSDRSLKLWDVRIPKSPVKTIMNAHENEILTVDWNKWDSLKFATGSVDLNVKIWDWRMLGGGGGGGGQQPLWGDNNVNQVTVQNLRGHRRAVRKLKWSPFSAGGLYSVSYDMTLRAWDLCSLNPSKGVWDGHTEFVTGLDISLYDRNLLLATCAWDQSIQILCPANWGQAFVPGNNQS